MLRAAILVCGCLIGSAYGGAQSIAVRGQLLCGTKPASAKLKLYEVDALTSDDFMAKNETNAQGYFYISGTDSEFSDIDVVLNIYHKCDLSIPLCDRKWKFKLPSSYITKGSTPSKVFDIGVWNLELEIDEEEERDCVNRKQMMKDHKLKPFWYRSFVHQ